MNVINDQGIIRFPNLRQYTDTTVGEAGEFTEVKAKAVAFTSNNARGLLRETLSIEAVRSVAIEDAVQIKSWVLGLKKAA